MTTRIDGIPRRAHHARREDIFMTRIIAVLCFGLLSLGTAHATDARASNVAPLAFGMTQQEASDALGAPLVLIAVQRRGGEVYFAARDARIPGYPAGERMVLQFRRGALTGWKTDWRIHKPWFF
jgi:hypothetical protein